MTAPEHPQSPEHAEFPERAELPDTTSRRGLVAGLVLGVPIIAYGIRGIVIDAADTHPGELARWIVGAAVVHDVLLVPAVLAAAAAARRLVRHEPTWRVVRSWFLVTGVLVLIGWPFARGYGWRPAVPSALNRNYTAGLAAYLAVVTVVAVLVALVVRRRAQG